MVPGSPCLMICKKGILLYALPPPVECTCQSRQASYNGKSMPPAEGNYVDLLECLHRILPIGHDRDIGQGYRGGYQRIKNGLSIEKNYTSHNTRRLSIEEIKPNIYPLNYVNEALKKKKINRGRV